MQDLSHWQVPVRCRLAESCEQFREPLQARLAARDVADDEPEQGDHLQHCSYGGEYGALQAHGEVERGDEGGEVDQGEGQSLLAHQVDQVAVGAPQEGEAGEGEDTAQCEQQGKLPRVDDQQGEE